MKKSLLFSGGVESTLLYYELLKNASENNSLNIFILDRDNKPIQKALSVYNLIKDSFDDTASTCNILEVPEGLNNTKRMMWAVNELSTLSDEIYWGINAYFDHIKPNQQIFKNVDEKIKRYPQLRFPYLNYTKDKIIEKYIKYNIEWILEHTHSCGLPENQPCGNCFNCREREYAYQLQGLDLHRGI